MIPIFITVLPLRTSFWLGFPDAQFSENVPPIRVREIFRYPKEMILLLHRSAEDRLCNLMLQRTSFLIGREFCLHSFSIFAAPGKWDGRSVGTNSCDPCIARVACSSASILMLNLI
jgi:hypothetical protein